MLSRRALLCLFPLLLCLMAFRDAPLVNPEPISLPASLNDQAIRDRVRKTLNARGWIVTEEHPGAITSLLRDGDRTARIGVEWADGRLALKYLDSENLKYHLEDGTPYVHKNYLGWIEDLSADLGIAFAAK